MANYTRMDTDRESWQELAFVQLILNIRNSKFESREQKRGDSCASIVEYISLQFQLPFKCSHLVVQCAWHKKWQVFPTGLFKLKWKNKLQVKRLIIFQANEMPSETMPCLWWQTLYAEKTIVIWLICALHGFLRHFLWYHWKNGSMKMTRYHWLDEKSIFLEIFS